MTVLIRYFFVGLFIFSVSSCGPGQNEEAEIKLPNILLLVADDLGYADLGCFGSDIETPNIDNLASEGVIFGRFHTAPTCAPTRAMLLTGNDNHIAGMGSQFRRTGEWGYEGYLSDRVVTIPQLLRDAGYHTYMAGKWHIAYEPENNPYYKGFEHSFAMLQGGGTHYDDHSLFGSSSDSLRFNDYTEDGETTTWPEGAYSTELYTDKLMEFIGRHLDDQKPFFAFAAYTSPHWPLQVGEEFWRKYEGRYDEGYEQLRGKNLERLKGAGLIPENTGLPEIHPDVKPWDSLSEDQRKIEARKMELYSGMVDNLDYHVGRLVDYLQDIGEYDNTLIIFMSDNGAADEDYYNREENKDYAQAFFNNDYENMGKPSSFVSYGPPWAEAGSAPFRYYKGYTTQGGIVAPMILAGSMISDKGTIHHGFTSVTDMAPTIYDLVGISYPENYNGNSVYPLTGESIMPFLNGESEVIHGADYVFRMEQSGNVMVRKGDWKLVNEGYPLDTANFKLYDLDSDLIEDEDLSSQYPDKRKELLDLWMRYREEVRVLDEEGDE